LYHRLFELPEVIGEMKTVTIRQKILISCQQTEKSSSANMNKWWSHFMSLQRLMDWFSIRWNFNTFVFQSKRWFFFLFCFTTNIKTNFCKWYRHFLQYLNEWNSLKMNAPNRKSDIDILRQSLSSYYVEMQQLWNLWLVVCVIDYLM
jgi:hypothetical protein